jgi:hypothetical protein
MIDGYSDGGHGNLSLLLDAPSMDGRALAGAVCYFRFPALYYTIGMIGFSGNTQERTSHFLAYFDP